MTDHTQVCWLIDDEMFDHYREELVAAIVEQGHEYKFVRAPSPGYSWDDTGYSYRRTFPADACVVTHGDIALAMRVRNERRWRPGAYCTVENFFCSRYYAYLGKFLLNRDYVMLPFGELERCKDFLFQALGANGRLFIRPDSPLKLFTGQCVSYDEYEKDLEYLAFYEFPRHELVVVSSPKEITAEWRFVVVNTDVVAGCQYTQNGQKCLNAEYDLQAHEVAKLVAQSGFAPDSVWIIDICKVAAGTYHLLEIGAFSFADLYATNKSAVVRAVSDQAICDCQAQSRDTVQ